jgi:hypothetical protein
MDRRRRLLGLGLVLTGALCAAIAVSDMPDGDTAIVGAVVRSDGAGNKTLKKQEAGNSVLLDKLSRGAMTAGDLNPFNAKSWYVPPPPPPPGPPPKPTAPPLPFTYIGKLEEEGGRWTVYLAKGEQSYVVKKGETFDNVYKLEGLENGNLVIQYIPLSIKQFLPIGGLS